MHTVFDLGAYAVHVGDLSFGFPAWLRERDCSQVFVVADENTARHCLPLFLEKTAPLTPHPSPLTPHPSPLTPHSSLLTPGERHKTLATCERLWQQMLDARLDRRALVINLGGGVVGDLGGFCAATWKRGVDFVQVPTTLLAMTDAAIGGKLGVDFQGVKNAVGVFQNPAAVFVDPHFLQTLPERELRSGLAEVIKHALIGDPDLLALIESSQNLVQREAMLPAFWHHVLCASIAVKARVVMEDPREQGLRMLLNYGHTVGHAVESYFLKTPFPLAHGEAVALGMICESWLARTVVPNGHNRLARVIGAVSGTFLHQPVPEAAFAEIWAMMQQDKKNAAAAVRAAVPGGEPFEMQVLELTEGAVTDCLRFYNDLG
jgi:3-dehydroquinate synthase